MAREMVKSMAVEAQAYRQDITSSLPSHWSAFLSSPSNGRESNFIHDFSNEEKSSLVAMLGQCFLGLKYFFGKFLLLPSNGEKKLSPANDLIGIL